MTQGHSRIIRSEPSTKEELESIPLLRREDIGRKAATIYNTEKSIEGVKVIHHNINTNGIGYLKLNFNIDKVEDELLPYVGLLTKVLGSIGTEKYSFVELSNAMDIRTGGISFGSAGTTFVKPAQGYRYALNVTGKALYGDLAALTELMDEIMNHTVYDDYKRLKEIIGETKGRYADENAGHRKCSGNSRAYSTDKRECHDKKADYRKRLLQLP